MGEKDTPDALAGFPDKAPGMEYKASLQGRSFRKLQTARKLSLSRQVSLSGVFICLHGGNGQSMTSFFRTSLSS